MSPKVRVALYWLASCGGCEESQVDAISDKIDIISNLEIVFWPVAMDFKKEDVEKLPDESIDVAVINGGVRLKEHAEMVKLLRRKSKIVIAYGSCASWGGIPGLANLYDINEVLSRVYSEVPTLQEKGIMPRPKSVTNEGVEMELTEVLPMLLPLDAVIDVDYYIPGCPPTPETFLKALETLLSGNLPPRKSVIGASTRALCEECPLNKTKPDKVLIKEIRRIYNTKIDPSKCLLVQGIPCLGPVTRGGCNARCPRVGSPCIGCYGPLDKHIDYGAKATSFIASILDLNDEDEIKKALDSGIPDPAGLVHKFTLPASRLKVNLKRGEHK
jgi:F420-non-reducing hydrogenase small subunit